VSGGVKPLFFISLVSFEVEVKSFLFAANSSRIGLMEGLVYEDRARYDLWLKLILGGVLVITLIVGVILISEDIEAALVMLGVTIFDALLFKAILPQRYQIFQHKVRIVLGGPFAVNIPFSNITEVREASSNRVFAYWGIRFATSTRYVMEIVRSKGLNLVISPASGDMFLEQLNQALQAAPNLVKSP